MRSATRSQPAPDTGLERLHPALHLSLEAFDGSSMCWGLADESDPQRGPRYQVTLRVGKADAQPAGRILEQHGFMRVPDGRRTGQTLFVTYHRATDQWVCVLVSAESAAEPGPLLGQGAGRPRRILERVREVARIIGSKRRHGITVALLGPDGSGKSTLAEDLQEAFYFPARRVYMGLWKETGSDSALKWRAVPGWSLASRLTKIWRDYLVGQYHRLRGRLVIFDRYAYDALVLPGGGRGRLDRIYAWVLGHACPEPDLVLVMDAPGHVMYSRKRESSLERLEAERQGFLSLQRRVPRLQIVDASSPRETVRADVTDRIWKRYIGN